MDPYSQLKLGREHLANGRLDDAMEIADELLTAFPDNDAVLFFAGNITAAARRLPEAAVLISKAIDVAPEHAHYHLALADVLASLSNFAAAHAAVLQTVDAAGNDLDMLQKCATYLSRLEDHDRALALFEKILARRPNDAVLNLNIATIHRFLGNMEKAEEYAGRAIALDPATTDAIWVRSDVRRVTEDDNHVAEIEALISEGKVDGRERAQCYFALARENEDLGRFEAAFDALQEGARLQRQSLRYDVNVEVSRMERICQCYNKAFFAQERTGHADERTPVFILGMPRTGSTLAERFLVAHPEVTSAGERNDFGTRLVRQSQRIMAGQNMEGNRVIEASVNVDFEQLGRAYLEAVSFFSGNTSHFIDKLPYNFLYAGIIRTALPNAKIVHVVRDPMDTCYAVYKALFERGYPFSYNLDELAAYYVAYRHVMAHWNEVLPGQIHEVRYEDIVNDTETTIRALVEHCGLAWNDACLDLGACAAPSMTASAAQVRRPVYLSSIGMWKNYAEQLEPLRKKLDDACVLEC